MSRTLYPLLFILCSSAALAQTPLIKEVKSGQILAEKPRLNVSKYRVYEINLPQLIAAVRNAPHINGLKAGPAPLITIPHPDGSIHRYQIRENNTMAPALAAKYPQLKAYDAVNIHDATEFAKIEVTPNGFHAMISKAGRSTIFIDPLIANNTQYYMVYYKQDFRAKDTMKCGVEYNAKTFKPLQHMRHLTDFNTCKHRTYRLAMAATAQYTAAAGGTKAAALAAQIVTVNRLNGIYQSELGVDFQLIEDNPDIIYTDPNNQPYTSGDPDKEINENQANIDLVIGSANYDIGHVVDVADSGLASLHSVCTVARKAMGVTGKKDPFGDPFDVDYVAHEFGHQFGANHTQNNRCNRNNDTAVEPGSGSTIMSYAGICAPNVQAHSSAYFHGVSLQEMGEFISDPEHNCPVETPIDPAPIITSLPQTVTIPAQTPFSLTAAAQSDDQSALLYNWEQVDDELSVQPPSPLSVGGPNFRSLPATTSPTRYFPNLAALANNSSPTWEVLSDVTRSMAYQLTVRKNLPISCNAYEDISININSIAGPFIIKYPNAPAINWTGNTLQKISWDVARTNYSPVDVQTVNVLLSTDNGLSFPQTFLSNVANNGEKNICVPNINLNNVRFMIEAANKSFFNVSRHSMTVTAVPPQPPQLLVADRNPLRLTQARIKIANCISATDERYTLNGIAGASVRYDADLNQFIIDSITTPKKFTITITATDGNNVSRTSNPITIPSIL